jgi:glycosyltransferase involved in cell wall biosynthesis
MKNMHIVFLTPGFPKDESDTACLPYLQDYTKNFSQMVPGMRITVIAFQYPYGAGIYSWNGVVVHALAGRRSKLLRLLTWARAFRCFAGIHLSQRVDVIHSFWLTECTYVGQYLASLYDIKHVASIMGQDALGKNLYFQRLKFSRMTVTACSAHASESFGAASERTADAIIPWGLDTKVFDNLRNKGSRPIDIIGVGSLTPVKNYGLFVDVIEAIKKSFPNVNAVIVGDGEEMRPLSRKISELKLEKHIQLTGLLSRDQAIEYLFQSNILLHTASYEGQGYVFMEARYAGLSVVCFDVGFLIKSDKISICADKNDMIQKLSHLLNTQADYSKGLMCSVQSTVTSYKKLYEQDTIL